MVCFGAGVADRVMVGKTLLKLAFELKIHAFKRRNTAERAADYLKRVLRVVRWEEENHVLFHGATNRKISRHSCML